MKRADLAVGVAGDVDEDGVDGGLFLEPVQRGDGEELFEGPAVEERLEDGEVADVLVGEELLEVVEFLGLVTGLGALLGRSVSQICQKICSAAARFSRSR
jgi:hypothetical protein